MWACERMTASTVSIGTGSSRFFRSASFRLPWNRPQSRRMVLPLTRRMWHEPVTSLAAPANSSSTVRRVRRVSYFESLAAHTSFFRRVRRAMKENDEPVSVLAHQGGFPAATASLVQKIGQRVFVIPRVPSQFDHHRLVF